MLTRATITPARLTRAASTKEISWRRGNAVVEMIRAEGLRRFAARLPRLSDASALQDRTIRCIDEGTPGGIHVRGAGILLPFAEAVHRLRPVQADGVTSHAGCGGAALYARRNGIPAAEADAAGIAHAIRLADALAVPYRGHIDAQLQRPREYHDARAVYVDATGRFDPSRVPNLPKGFVVSAWCLSAEYALDEVGFCIATALSEHGFGDRFTTALPLLILTVGDALDPVLLQQLAAPHDGRVALDALPVE